MEQELSTKTMSKSLDVTLIAFLCFRSVLSWDYCC